MFLVPCLTLISNGLTNISATKNRKGEEPLLLLNSRLAIKSFAFLRTYYLRNTNHTVAGIFLSRNLTLIRKRPTHISSTNFWSQTEKVKSRCSCNFHVWLLQYPPLLEPISVCQLRATNNVTSLRNPHANDWLIVYNDAKLMLSK